MNSVLFSPVISTKDITLDDCYYPNNAHSYPIVVPLIFHSYSMTTPFISNYIIYHSRRPIIADDQLIFMFNQFTVSLISS